MEIIALFLWRSVPGDGAFMSISDSHTFPHTTPYLLLKKMKKQGKNKVENDETG